MYDCMHGLFGNGGQPWLFRQSLALLSHEPAGEQRNSYSRACEIRGKVEGTINEAVLHDIIIFKEFLIMILRI